MLLLRAALQQAYPPDVLAELLAQLGDTEEAEQTLFDGLFPKDVQELLLAQAEASNEKALTSVIKQKQSVQDRALRRHSCSVAKGSALASELSTAEGCAPATAVDKALQPGPLLQYPSHLEPTFVHWHSASQRVTDNFGALVYVMLASFAYLTWAKCLYNSMGLSAVQALAPSISVTCVLGGSIPLFQHISPSKYVQHRDAFIATGRAINVIYNLLHRRWCPDVHNGNLVWLALLIGAGTLPLAGPAIRHRIRFSTHIKLHTFLALLCVVSIVGGGEADPRLMKQGLLCVLIAYVVPSIVVYVCELNARKAFARSYTARMEAVGNVKDLYKGRFGFATKSV